MTNTFFDRNTISNWGELYPQRQGLAKIRSKRAYSHSELKIDPSKFQHRQVFDSKIYEKVNFFRLGFKQLRDKNEKQQKSYHSATLKQLLNELSVNLNEKSFLNFNANYSNYWSLIEDSSEKQKVVEIMTETINNLLKKIIQKIGQLNKAKHQIEQSMLRTQVDLKLIRKQQIRIPENQLKLSDRNQEKQKKMHQKLKVLDFELKKEMLKSQQLEQRLIGQGHEVQQLKKENKQLLNQKQKERSYKQTMQFKVKRLKQQLQVANIIKQQNLTDKMKYIMNW